MLWRISVDMTKTFSGFSWFHFAFSPMFGIGDFFILNQLVMWTVIITLYLIGYVLSYILLKFYIAGKEELPWTLGDRKFCLGYSIFSWIAVIFAMIMIIIENFPKQNNDREVKW